LPLYRPVLLALRAALCVLLTVLLLLGDLTAALIVAVFLALSFTHLLRNDGRPAVFDVFFALAGAVGYAFDLFGEIVPYDELTHAFTTFSVSLAFYFLFYGGAVPERRAVALATSVFTLGVTVGAFWEIFEWFFAGKYTLAVQVKFQCCDEGDSRPVVTMTITREGAGGLNDNLDALPEAALRDALHDRDYELPRTSLLSMRPSGLCGRGAQPPASFRRLDLSSTTMRHRLDASIRPARWKRDISLETASRVHATMQERS